MEALWKLFSFQACTIISWSRFDQSNRTQAIKLAKIILT